MDLLVAWNKSLRLTAFSDPGRIFGELICDSFHLAAFLEKLVPDFQGEIWDPGAGAGLPGIPLRIIWRKGNYTMIEAREKRALFLANALARLKLPRTLVAHCRVEDFLARNPGPQCVVSRAFMPWPKLLALFQGRLHGFMIIMANDPPPASLSWKLIDQRQYQAGGRNRMLWAIAPPE